MVVVFLVAFLGAAVIALLMWRAMNTERTSQRTGVPGPSRSAPVRPSGRRATGPDDDPDFLRKLDEAVKRREDPPTDQQA
ncbi:hypothetical protein Psed_5605 [Pseudonocardia dioxanivorans CB1190]|uniref:Uncharacterized protein n=1 Tax=Pseudonocardia dioxanivorans (strain ATCC 55486 / DSM 44775 / JCM 13855 / CB1190) TaxID=675635 RepID=F4CZQ7_PSEUX|nr:hypothetical protein Psed_5605 [Pseudonocardia dioxanivorans CB1190]